MTDDILRRQLAPTGILRAGINLSNFLLVTGRGPDGAPQGVAPDMAAAGRYARWATSIASMASSTMVSSAGERRVP